MTVQQKEYRAAVDHFAETISAKRGLGLKRALGWMGLTLQKRGFRDLRRKAIRYPIPMYLILLSVGIGSALAIRHISGHSYLDNPTFYLGVPAILLGAYQAWLTSMINRPIR